MKKAKHFASQRNYQKSYQKGCKSSYKRMSKIIVFIFLFGICLVLYSSIHLYQWYLDSIHTKESIANIHQNTIISEIDENGTTLIDVDFSKLKEINSDTIGWIQVSGTDINYPFVQTNNNDYYLNHSFDKTYNTAGWIFLDDRNNIHFLNQNTILYAHGRLDRTMFGSLKDLLNHNWYDKNQTPTIKISTEKQNTAWQIFSAYRIPSTSDYLQINFDTDYAFKNFATMLQSRSVYDFHTTIDSSDKIITLSTCYNNNSKERLVIHAKLITL